MRKYYFTLLVLFAAFQSFAQVSFEWNENFDAEKKIAETIASTSSRVVDTETIMRFWRVHSLQNSLSPEVNIEKGSLNFQFFINSDKKIDAVTYFLRGFKRTKDGYTNLIYSELDCKQVIDSLKLEPRIKDFVAYMNSQEIPFRSNNYAMTLGNIRNQLNANGIKKWEILKNSTRLDTVTKLSFRNFKMTEVPLEIQRFVNLKQLDLSGNYLQSIPKHIFKLKKLETVDVSRNAITAKQFLTKRNKSITIINLQENAFRTLPKKLKKLKSLDYLIAGKNSLDQLSNYPFHRFKKLKTVNFYNASLRNVPKKLFRVGTLEELDLYYNFIRLLDGDLSKWTNLKTLALSYNNMWKLPDETYELTSLKTLFAHHNKIEKLPSLPSSLEILDIGYNDFTEFPFAINSLRNLKELDYNGNNVDRPILEDYLPENLEILFIKNNPLFINEQLKSKSEAFIVDLQKRNIDIR